MCWMRGGRTLTISVRSSGDRHLWCLHRFGLGSRHKENGPAPSVTRRSGCFFRKCPNSVGPCPYNALAVERLVGGFHGEFLLYRPQQFGFVRQESFSVAWEMFIFIRVRHTVFIKTAVRNFRRPFDSLHVLHVTAIGGDILPKRTRMSYKVVRDAVAELGD